MRQTAPLLADLSLCLTNIFARQTVSSQARSALPMAGAGLFGLKFGMIAPVMTLILHLIWGAVLGYTYEKLTPRGAAAA